MKTSAIITEYNPLHLGHLYHINYTRKETGCDALICIMSGNFTQRGVPAIIDKWTRAKMAINSGIDLVIELPVIFSVASAEFFSRGAVELLHKLNVVDYLSFGSEIGDIELINNIAKILADEPESFTIYLKKQLGLGLPFAVARTNALKEYLNHNRVIDDNSNLDVVLNSSNNILAIEYCKALYNLNSNIAPITLKRLGDSYNTETPASEFTSATAIRNLISKKSFNDLINFVPKDIYDTIMNLEKSNYPFTYSETMYPYLKYKLLLQRNLNRIPDAGEGIDNKIYKEVVNASSLNNLIMLSKSKRYTYTRISRILCQYFMGFEEFDINSMRKESPNYLRILAFNDTGRELLKEIKKKSEISIFTKMPNTLPQMLSLDINSTKAYSVINPMIKPNEDYLRSPTYI